MYRITKVLNHNTVLAVKDKSAREYLIVGKGVGFGKKITQSVEPTEEDSLYVELQRLQILPQMRHRKFQLPMTRRTNICTFTVQSVNNDSVSQILSFFFHYILKIL